MRVALPSLLLCALASAQGARLELEGAGVVGTTQQAFLVGAAPGSLSWVLVSPSAGPARLGVYSTECFGLTAGAIVLGIQVDPFGLGRRPFNIPVDPSFPGTDLYAQAFSLPGFQPSNCARMRVLDDIGRPHIAETFAASRPALAVHWGQPVAGSLAAPQLGGSGVLGEFDASVGTLDPTTGARVFRTDSQTFPGSVTLSGQPITVTDGRFHFLDLRIPPGVHVRFEGPHPARLFVAGSVEIQGELDVGGRPLAVPSGAAGVATGQAGGEGGAGGGSGGDGGSAAGGSVEGADGDDLVPVVPSLFTDVAGTGGGGSRAVPLDGDAGAVTYRFFGLFSNQIASGGGGGGFRGVGSAGSNDAARNPGGGNGAPGVAGVAATSSGTEPSAASRDAFLVGGSGGGGGGAHPYDSVFGQPAQFVPGMAGGGGGGALLLVIGGDATIAPGGAIRSNGGDAARRTHLDGALRSPGGGGSGGSVLLQVAGTFSSQGVFEARGGVGGSAEDLRATPGAIVRGGDGAEGQLRVEGHGLGPIPGVATGSLQGFDRETAVVSPWYPLPAGADLSAPNYEVHLLRGTTSVIYSDRADGLGTPAVPGASSAVLHLRYADLDGNGQPVPGTETAWALGAPPSAQPKTGVQFVLRFDRGLLGPRVPLQAEAVRLLF